MSKYNRVWTVNAEQVTKETTTIQRDRHGVAVVPKVGQWIVIHADGGFEVIDDAVFQVNYAPVIEHTTNTAPETVA